MEEDPQILWRRIGAGDRQAFTTLYERHQEDVLRFCHALVRDPDDAREAANSTWASVWRSRAAAQRDIPLRPWLFRIAHNEAIDILRRRRPHEQLDVAMAGPDDPAADAELHERLATLREDLLTLTDHQRGALVLREMSGLGHEEIGAVLDISAAAAKQTIYEARQALLEAEGGRSLSCDLVRRDISAGDRRVLRNRRIRAHLRTCAACREFADGVDAQRRRFRAVLPAPIPAAILARIGPGAEVGGGGSTAAAGFSAWGAKVGGTVAVKVAAAAIGVAAVGGGAASGVVLSHGDRSAAVAAHVAAAPAAPPVQRGVTRQVRSPDRAAPPQAAGPGRDGAPPLTPTAPARREAAAPNAPTPQGTAAVSAAPAKTAAEATAPGQAETSAPPAATPKVPPGQAKKQDAPSGATKVPPGQAKKDAPPGATKVPPGQAKKQDAPPAADTTTKAPPGQVRKQNSSPTPTPPHEPPGQAKKQDAPPAPAPASEPPGQAKQQAPAPPSQAAAGPPASTAPPAAAQPSGQGPGHGHGGR